MTTETTVVAAGARDAQALGILNLFNTILMTICSLDMYMEPQQHAATSKGRSSLRRQSKFFFFLFVSFDSH